MLKDTKSLGNNKAPACESRGFVRKKQKVCILTHLRIDQPTHRTEYQKETGAARFYYLRPIGFGSAMLGRVYKRNTHPGDSEMCICRWIQVINATPMFSFNF